MESGSFSLVLSLKLGMIETL